MTVSLGLFSHFPITAGILILLLVIGLTIISYFAYQRLKHKKIRLAGVLIANTIAVLAVIGLAFDIQILAKHTAVTYLITNGTTSQQLASIDPQQSVFVMRDAAKSITGREMLDNATVIDIPSQVLSHQPAFDNLHVIGDGLSSTQWHDLQLLMGETFSNITITFSASNPRIGLVNIQWPKELAVGQYVEVKGQLQGVNNPVNTNDIYQLNLLNPVGKIVETLRLKTTDSFTLSFPAKSIGQWVYRLQLSKPNNINLVADEPIAFSVTKPAPLRILIKQSAPSFETRQLKNWAANFGSKISILTQISQNKDIRQNINLSPLAIESTTKVFTDQTLLNFDWLFIDGRALLTLTEQQMTALQTATNNGLGVYIIADNELINAWPAPSLDWLLGIDIQPVDVANYSAVPYWPHSKIEQVIPLINAAITSVSGSFLVQNNNAKILVSRSNIGLGQVAVSLINSTYSWQTSGLTEQYSHYWQSVIYELARPKQTPYWLSTNPDKPHRVNQRIQRCLLGTVNSGKAFYNQDQLPLVLSPGLLQTEQRCLTIWPTNEGWHKLTWSQNPELTNTHNAQTSLVDTWLYVHGEEDWSVWQQVQKQQASQNLAKQLNTKLFDTVSIKSLDKIWFWGLLVLLMSMLWLEQKLF